MHARTVLQRLLGPALSGVDARNARNLLTAVCACISGRRLVMMELARHWPGATQVSAPLKRLDRLLGNPRMHAARGAFYHTAAHWLIRHPKPVILVDWSELGDHGRWQLLRASIAGRGRSLTLYEEIHPQAKLGAPDVHAAFLRRLRGLLPKHVRPIVVTDAGFKVPWFRAVEALGWHWLGRVRGRIGVKPIAVNRPFAPWQPVRKLYARANRQARDLGPHHMTTSNPVECRLVSIAKPPKGRHQYRRRDGGVARGGKARKLARAQSEPWVLACSSSLASTSAKELTRLYGLRMQIEASFRDLKSHRYGCGFEDTQTRRAKRLEMLLLIHLLATLVAWARAVSSRVNHEYRFRISLLRRGWEQLRRFDHTIHGPPERAMRLLRQLVDSPAIPG